MSLSSQTKKVQKLKFFQEIRSNSYLGIVSTTNVVIEMQLLIEVQSRQAIFLAA